MGRKRNPADAWLPPRVYRGKSAFEFRPAKGGCVKLAPLSAARPLVWARYQEVLSEADQRHLFAGLHKAYFESREFKKLAPETQKGYSAQGAALKRAFGAMRCTAIKTVHVRAYMDKRANASSERMANRHLSLLSVMCNWGRERGYLESNPCEGVKRYREEGRDRYVTDEEYKVFHDAAPLHVRAAMEIAYLCGARQADVLKLTTFELRTEGVYIRQGKTGKKQIKSWSPRLRAAVEACRAKAPAGTTAIICNAKGKPYTRDGWGTAWQRTRDKLKEKGIIIDWTFHDLKAKGISDFEGDKKQFSGHATDRMVALYDRKVRVVPTIGSDEEK